MSFFTFLLYFVIIYLFVISLLSFLIELEREFFEMVIQIYFLNFSLDMKILFKDLFVQLVISFILYQIFKNFCHYLSC